MSAIHGHLGEDENVHYYLESTAQPELGGGLTHDEVECLEHVSTQPAEYHLNTTHNTNTQRERELTSHDNPPSPLYIAHTKINPPSHYSHTHTPHAFRGFVAVILPELGQA